MGAMHSRDARIRVGAAAAAAMLALAVLDPALAPAERLRYDAPAGFERCPRVVAWNGFFKWTSVRRTTCRRARRFMRAYAAAASRGPMPRCVRRFRCRIRFWRNADGDVYASRHACARGRVVIRFYGMA